MPKTDEKLKETSCSTRNKLPSSQSFCLSAY